MVFEREDTKNRVIDIIASELTIDKKSISEASTLSSLGADSLDMVEVIMKLEEQFGLEIKDEEAEQMKSVRDIAEYVQTHRTK